MTLRAVLDSWIVGWTLRRLGLSARSLHALVQKLFQVFLMNLRTNMNTAISRITSAGANYPTSLQASMKACASSVLTSAVSAFTE